MKTLAEFVAAEMSLPRPRHPQGMSIGEFADLLGVSKSTVAAYLHGDVKQPGMDFLILLSEKTRTSLLSLLILAYPNIRHELEQLPKHLSAEEERVLRTYRDADLAAWIRIFQERVGKLISNAFDSNASDRGVVPPGDG